jgi:hypothetical protein
MMDQ